MTDLLRNPEVRRDILIYSLLTVAAALAGALLGKLYMLSLLCAGIVFSTVHFITVYRRYVRIRALSEKIDQVLHGENAIRFSDFGEGELSVLGNEIEKMTLRLREKTDHLQKEKTYLADAIADISHQLRTPLTSIHLLLTLLSDEALNERRRMELLRELNLLLNRMEWLVDSLLKMSKLDAGTAMFQPEMVSAGMLMKTAAEPLLIPMELREQTLVLETGSETILTDPNWTSEAIGNLLKNCM